MKRAIDVAVAGIAFVLLSPLLLAAAVLVRLTMGSPIIFRQTRAGWHGVPFDLLKFRTMKHPSPGKEAPEYDATRITRLGNLLRRTSVDELPSLLNVLNGQLSIVGPRPLPVAYVERYSPEQARRLLVRPGLTGWAVVHGRNSLDWETRFELDCWYVDHRSLALDLQIMLRTLALVLKGSGVNHSPGVTMTEFGRDRG
jgi:hypothetical protein